MRLSRFAAARPALVVVAVLGMTIWLSVAGLAQGGPPPKPKNLKVLKNLPPGQLIPTMMKINASLGVRCDYCHVINPDRTGWEKDDKPAKRTAREMMRMVEDLNAHQKILDKKATCFMCHHGKAAPEVQAPRMQPPMGGGGPGGGRR